MPWLLTVTLRPLSHSSLNPQLWPQILSPMTCCFCWHHLDPTWFTHLSWLTVSLQSHTHCKASCAHEDESSHNWSCHFHQFFSGDLAKGRALVKVAMDLCIAKSHGQWDLGAHLLAAFDTGDYTLFLDVLSFCGFEENTLSWILTPSQCISSCVASSSPWTFNVGCLGFWGALLFLPGQFPLVSWI